MKQPSFTVVIPLYQKRATILRSLQSVLAQTYPVDRIIVVDDGSTDGGGELVKSVNDARLMYLRQENRGVSAARNVGVEMAGTSYVAFLDADDTWESNHIAELCRLAVLFPEAPILGTSWTEFGKPVLDPFIDIDPFQIDLSCFFERTAKNFPPFWTSATAIKAAVCGGRELFPVGSRIAEDQDAWITLLQVGAGVRSLNVTAHYNVDEASPTIAAPRAQDFESVIFNKWDKVPISALPQFVEFLAAHRLYTIERHAGHTSPLYLIKLALLTRTRAQRLRKYRAVGKALVSWLESWVDARR